ncbi:hypothetical protein AGMMS49574_13760 [Bacteroidia bacterium]|nr:hypothetical protein AGMMS49574_13760 [Bacteroidia bacterium]
MNGNIVKLACVLIGVSLGCISLMGQDVKGAKAVQAALNQKWERQRNSFILSTGPSIPDARFSVKDPPLVGKGYGYAMTGRTFDLRYSHYIDEGISLTASLEHKYFGIDYERYNRALNMDQNSPIKGSSVSFPGKKGFWSEGWNILALAIGPSYRYGVSSQLYLETYILVGLANSYIPAISISTAGDDGKYADFITMGRENKRVFYTKMMVAMTYLLSESVFLSCGFGSTDDIGPSFTGHDFTFNEDGSRTPKKTNYSMTSFDLSVGIGYSF